MNVTYFCIIVAMYFIIVLKSVHVIDWFCMSILEHAMKVVERIFEHRIRQQIEIDDMQFGFMKGKGTTDATFMARQNAREF